MKKIAALIFAVCLLMLLTVPAFADGRGPAFTSYDVVCTKETPYYRENWENDGAWEKQGTFSAGRELTVLYEYEHDGVLYGDVRIGYGENEQWVYVRLSDVEMKNDTYLPENAQKLPRAHTVRVTEKGGIPLYAGPNKKYSKVMTIPRGTKLTYTYGNDEEDYFRTWAYVTYLGRSGWIYVFASDTKNGLVELPDAHEEARIWVLADGVQMYSGLSFGNIEDRFPEWDAETLAERHEEPDRVTGTLEKGKKYTYQYYHSDNFGMWYHVTAGLHSGWVYMGEDRNDLAVPADRQENGNALAFRSFKLKLRETPDEEADAATVTIEKNTTITPAYMTYSDYERYYYITVGEQSGWYTYEDVNGGAAFALGENAERNGYDSQNSSDQAAPIYSDIVQKGKTVGKIPAGGGFTPLYYGHYETKTDEDDSTYTWFYYVRYKDVTGWVDESDLLMQQAEEADEPEEEYDDYDAWEEDEPDEEEWDDSGWEEDFSAEDDREEDELPEDDAVDDYVPRSGLSPLQIVLLCVGGAVILALTAAVTLLLVRRKRREKQPQDDPEQPQADAEE